MLDEIYYGCGMNSEMLSPADTMNEDAQSKRVRVSIGMPVYNGERYLEAALEALLGQSFKDFELIISDNASDDSTPEICRKFAGMDSRIRYFRGSINQGAAWNFNHVFSLAKGEYFMWASHDDLWEPRFIEKCAHVLDNNPNACLCYSITIVIDGNGRHIKEIPVNPNLESSKASKRFGESWQFPPQIPVFGLIRSDILKTTPLIGNYSSSDRTLAGELALRGPFCAVHEPLFFYRRHENQSTGERNKTGWKPRRRHNLNAWYDPARRGRISFPHWRLLKEYVAAISRVSPGILDRFQCYLVLARWMLRFRMGLLLDLIAWPVPPQKGELDS
jgi:glycosyltransferase involved in cell wall biosynthesis